MVQACDGGGGLVDGLWGLKGAVETGEVFVGGIGDQVGRLDGRE